MKKILVILIVLTGISPMSQANLLIWSYSHVPCDNWNFGGTCAYTSSHIRGAEAGSVQRAIDLLARKIDLLEQKVNFLSDENESLKEKLLNK